MKRELIEKVCEYCGNNPGAKPGNKWQSHGKPFLWNGFIDKDTNQLVCSDCRHKHYEAKAKTEYKYLYSEFPVVLNE